MSLSYIRETYRVPAYKGQRLVFTNSEGAKFYGTIKTARDQYLIVLMDERKGMRKGHMILHPTWNIEYLDAKEQA